jgi:RNA polymerase sigma factor (sigma-70 family)
MILDKDIPTADPGALIIQYTPLLYKLVRRYKQYLENLPAVDEEDLLQAGRIAIYTAQKQYDPDGGASFLTYAFDHIRSMMRRTMRFKADGSLPEEALISLDEPLNEDSDETKLDFVPDTTPTAEERIIAQDDRQEVADAVHAAVDRLKSSKQREVMRRVWLDGQDRETAAAEMGTTYTALCSADMNARTKLRRDNQLRQFAILRYPFFRVGVRKFQNTFISATERAVLWRERVFDEQFGEGAFVTMPHDKATIDHDPETVQTSTITEARS